MPRTLPWLQDASTNRSARGTSSPSTVPRNKRTSSPDKLVNSDLEDIDGEAPSRGRLGKRSMARTPSTSPPPAPPDVEFMREGHDADDIWMMVEDEFLSTAKLFTNHMHYQEYERVKRRARARGDWRLSRLERGMDGVTEKSAALKLREEARRNAEQRQALGSAADSGESEDADEFLQDPQLAGLMMSGSRTVGRDLTGLAKPKLKKKAQKAATNDADSDLDWARDSETGSLMAVDEAESEAEKPVEDDEESEDDDLDSRPVKKPLKTPLQPSKPAKYNTNHVSAPAKDDAVSGNAGFFKRFANPVDASSQTSASPSALPTMVATPVKRSSTVRSVPRPSPSKQASAEVKKITEVDDRSFTQSQGGKGSKAREYLLKHRQNQAKREEVQQEEEPRAKKPVRDLPTFVF